MSPTNSYKPMCPKHPTVRLHCPACEAAQRKVNRGREPIQDEFTNAPLSRQEKYRQRQKKRERAKAKKKARHGTGT